MWIKKYDEDDSDSNHLYYKDGIDSVLMQYTSLDDIYKTSIYEGDYIGYKNNNDFIAEVVFYNYGFYAKTNDKYIALSDLDLNNIIVKGNIFE